MLFYFVLCLQIDPSVFLFDKKL